MTFPEEEYRERLKKIKNLMLEKKVEVLISSHPANIYYITGYNYWSFYVPQCAIISVEEEEPVWIGRKLDLKAAEMDTWMNNNNIRGYPDHMVQSPEDEHPVDFIAQFIKNKGWDKKNIGLEMDQFYFTHKAYKILEGHLDKAIFRDCSLLVSEVRQVKSALEIEYIKKAGKISEKAISAGIDKIEPGIRECDVAAEIYHTQIKGTAEYGGDYPAIAPLMPAGKKVFAPHSTWTDRKYEKNETVILELSGCYKRYHAPVTRTIFLGAPPRQLVEIAEIVTGGLNEILATFKAGIPAEKAAKRWNDYLAKYGYNDASRLGYNFGMNYPPDWGEQTVSIRPGDRTILRENMTFHLIPIIRKDKYVFETSISIRIIEKGFEKLYNIREGLSVK